MKSTGFSIVLNYLNSNFTIITIFVLSLAYLNHIFFYYQFSIPIYNYIQITEIITLFVPFLIKYIFDFIILIFLIIIFNKALSITGYQPDESREYTVNNVKIKDSTDLIRCIRGMKFSILFFKSRISWKKPLKIIKIFIYFITCVITFLVYMLLYIGVPIFLYNITDDNQIVSQDYKLHISVYFILYIYVCFAVYSIINFLFNILLKIKMDLESKKIYLFMRIIFVIIFVYFSSVNQARNIKSGFAEYDVEFTYNNKLIKTNDSLVYISATQNYYFLRNRLTRENYIYKSDKIENLKMKKIAYTFNIIFQ